MLLILLNKTLGFCMIMLNNINMEMSINQIVNNCLELKAQNPDVILFARLGDFWECFNADAELVAKALTVTLTGRTDENGARMLMVGVPDHSVEKYVTALKLAGHTVALLPEVA